MPLSLTDRTLIWGGALNVDRVVHSLEKGILKPELDCSLDLVDDPSGEIDMTRVVKLSYMSSYPLVKKWFIETTEILNKLGFKGVGQESFF